MFWKYTIFFGLPKFDQIKQLYWELHIDHAWKFDNDCIICLRSITAAYAKNAVSRKTSLKINWKSLCPLMRHTLALLYQIQLANIVIAFRWALFNIKAVLKDGMLRNGESKTTKNIILKTLMSIWRSKLLREPLKD